MTDQNNSIFFSPPPHFSELSQECIFLKQGALLSKANAYCVLLVLFVNTSIKCIREYQNYSIRGKKYSIRGFDYGIRGRFYSIRGFKSSIRGRDSPTTIVLGVRKKNVKQGHRKRIFTAKSRSK